MQTPGSGLLRHRGVSNDMSQSTGTYALGTFGLTATQRMVLASLCKLSQNRAVTYVMQDPAMSGRDTRIAIVDADDTNALHRWKYSSVPRGLPVVFVSAAPLTDLESHQYNLLRSHMSGGLLQLLDRVATNELGHKAPVFVGDTAAARRNGASQGPAANRAIARALVIDDSLSVRTQMNLCLEKFDISAEVAENAHDGLQKLQERYYDIVFLDVMLPDMDGYQVCKLIKKDPGTRRLPVVMLTSKGSTINRIQGSIAGCDRYLIKPAAERDVVRVMRDFLPALKEHVN